MRLPDRRVEPELPGCWPSDLLVRCLLRPHRTATAERRTSDLRQGAAQRRIPPTPHANPERLGRWLAAGALIDNAAPTRARLEPGSDVPLRWFERSLAGELRHRAAVKEGGE